MTASLPEFDAIAARQGWNRDGVALVALSFVSSRALGPALARFAARIAAAENADTAGMSPDDPGCFAHLEPGDRQIVRTALRNYAAAGARGDLSRTARQLLERDGASVELIPDIVPGDRVVLVELLEDIAGVGRRGELAVLADPEGQDLHRGLLLTSQGVAPAQGARYRLHAGWAPYASYDEAYAARAAGTFTTQPFKPEVVVRDLVEQLDAIGVPDWAGAEGLSLDAARAFLAGPEPDALRHGRIARAERDAIGWHAPDFPYEDWQAEVANGDTRRSYGDWVLHRREEAAAADHEELVSEAFVIAERVADECSDDEDREVAGRYHVTFEPPVAREHVARLALDEFHDTVAVGVLDDFEFTVEDADGTELAETESGASANSGPSHVTVAKVDE